MRKIFFFLLILSAMFFSAAAEAKEQIAFSHLTDDFWQIWVMDPDGKNKYQVTISEFDKRDPAWLRNGKQLAFRTSNGELFLVNLDGSDEHEILKQYNSINNPAFSHKTDDIVFVRFDPRGKDMGDIWKSSLDGKSSKLLTNDALGKFQPNFSSQADKITFVKADPDRKNYIFG